MYVFSWIIILLCYSKTYLRSTSIETFLYLCQTQRDSASVVTLKSFKSRLKLYLQGNVIHSHVSQCSTVIYGIPYNIVLTHFRALNVEYFVEYDGIAIIWKTNENWYFSRYISMKNLIHVIHDILRVSQNTSNHVQNKKYIPESKFCSHILMSNFFLLQLSCIPFTYFE